MGAFRHGIKTTLRTPGKTSLFSLSLLLLAVLVSVSFSVFAAVRGYLRDCEAFFHTVAELEYLGSTYPDATVYDAAMVRELSARQAELDALCQAEELISFEPATNALALAEGLHRKDLYCFDPDAAVLQLYVMGYDKSTESYFADIKGCLYSRRDETGKMVLLRIRGEDGAGAALPEAKGTYLVCGHFFLGSSSYLWFQAEPMDCPVPAGTQPVPAFTKWTEQSPAENDYTRLAAWIEAANDGCPVQYTAAPEDHLPFHQEILTLQEGRLFTAEEAARGEQLCVISAPMAKALSRSVGDTVRLSVWESEGDLYHSPRPALEARDYRIVGVYGHNDDYPFHIFLPGQAEAGARVRPVNGYRLGQFRIQNSGAADFLAGVAALEAAGFRLTVYDQGYASAVEPMGELLVLSDIFLLVSLLLVLAVLCLQCHLFISRLRETAQTMLALGSGRAYIRRCFLGGAWLTAVPTSALGCALGRLLEQGVLELLARWSASYAAQELRFSSSRLSLVRSLAFAPEISPWVYVAAGLLLLLGSTLLTLAFSASALRDHAAKKRRRRCRPRLPAIRRSSRLRGPLKYALLSIRRSRARTAAALLLALVIVLFFGRLSASLEGYQTQLEAVRQNTVLTGRATDAKGQAIDGLVVSSTAVTRFLDSGLTAKHNVSDRICNLRFLGVCQTAEGRVNGLPEPYIPTDAFGIETLFGQMYSEPQWVRSSSVEGSPLFYNTKAVELRWLEGYGEHSMSGAEWCCVLPRPLMETHGIALGDTCRFLFALYDYGSPIIDTVELKVVGSYTSAADSQTVFSPIGCTQLPNRTAFYGHVRLGDSSYDSFLFTLRNAGELDAVRAALEKAGFTWVRSGKRMGNYAVLDDAVYLSTVRSMERQLEYVRLLYGCLYFLAGILGLVLSWLMTASRRPELALMRALGARPIHITANFCAEQSLLCGAGLLAGLGLWRLLGRSFTPAQLLLTAGFFALWSLTALLCAGILARQRSSAALTEPE